MKRYRGCWLRDSLSLSHESTFSFTDTYPSYCLFPLYFELSQAFWLGYKFFWLRLSTVLVHPLTVHTDQILMALRKPKLSHTTWKLLKLQLVTLLYNLYKFTSQLFMFLIWFFKFKLNYYTFSFSRYHEFNCSIF